MAAEKSIVPVKESKNESLKVGIVGGGLVGALAALNMAQSGHDVHMYEYREDIRRSQLVQGRSINLALSQRGRKALAEVGLEDVVLSTAIPMRGRMLHDERGSRSIVTYDPCTNQCLYSVGRKHLNEVLLTAGEKFPNIKYHFQHKLLNANLNEGCLHFRGPDRTEKTDKVDLIIGCDGAFSAVRQQMIKIPGMNFSQEYIEHGYLELCIPAKNGDFQMPPNYLHIWPRDSYMMIALPNQDKSFTVTLTMPFTIFESIATYQNLLEFFKRNFSDAVPLIGEDRLVTDFFKSKPQYLISVKCRPYHYRDKVVIIGDAAHAMVPFYGQGMNAGMEDCTILMSILNEPKIDIGEALKKFTNQRYEDAHAICDLAMYNYVEMRDLTKRLQFRIRKWFDTMLFRLFPSFWVPLYNSVSFTSMPYSKCIANRKWQDRVLKEALYVFILSAVVCVFAVLFKDYLLRF